MTPKAAPVSTESRSPRGTGGPDRRRRRCRLAVVAAGLAVLALAAGSFAWSRRGADPDRLWRAAQEALKAQRIDEAEELADRLSRLRSPDPMDWMLLAQVDIARDRVDRALEEL